jgi:hypothetical protein
MISLPQTASTQRQLTEVINKLDASLAVSSTDEFDETEHRFHDSETGLTIYPVWRCQPSYRQAVVQI